MAAITVDLTYGSALFQAAKEVDKVALILEEATAVLGIFDQEPDFLAFMNTPAIAAKEKKMFLEKIFGGKICDELLNLMFILIDKGRTRHFSKIVKTYEGMINVQDGIANGKILSVKPLSKERLSKFEEETGKLLQKKVKLENEFDPSLIGGIKIYVDGKVIDASIKKRIQDLSITIGQ